MITINERFDRSSVAIRSNGTSIFLIDGDGFETYNEFRAEVNYIKIIGVDII